ncbi:hypothetical protein [Streptomyces sp. NL15-2K]|uniref:Rhs family protein n=2 Tax=Streptomyces sp. NL15-2K TaxID=376149 RepID=A0ACD6B9U2_9ACTN|nr:MULTISPECIES: hypothetical protein [Actinomycetes]WKX06017.1 hypothetical protein Q4V64_00305 [Kutzneria buriramensis]GCB53263.1 rhs family protein [Streptomyces sp. NL15-2K]
MGDTTTANDVVTVELVEKVTKKDLNESGSIEGFGPGMMATYWCDVFDTEGKHIGTTVGCMDILYADPESGHLVEHVAEQIRLPDGTIMAWGTMNRSDVLAQKWITYRCQGTSGRYAGLVGTRTWRIQSLEDESYPIVAKMELRGA